MQLPRSTLLRDVIALLLIVVACPVALYGGSLAGCVGQGFTSACAMSAIFIAPVLLLGAGGVAGFVTRGWRGLGVLFVGVLIGMATILVLTMISGRSVPLDPISGFIATVWFGFPVMVGYAGARLVSNLVRRSPQA